MTATLTSALGISQHVLSQIPMPSRGCVCLAHAGDLALAEGHSVCSAGPVGEKAEPVTKLP